MKKRHLFLASLLIILMILTTCAAKKKLHKDGQLFYKMPIEHKIKLILKKN